MNNDKINCFEGTAYEQEVIDFMDAEDQDEQGLN